MNAGCYLVDFVFVRMSNVDGKLIGTTGLEYYYQVVVMCIRTSPNFRRHLLFLTSNPA